jgi:hypothetical protein
MSSTPTLPLPLLSTLLLARTLGFLGLSFSHTSKKENVTKQFLKALSF